ncbi:glutamate-1-semialdehyde 2,1-aminomutase [Actinomycetospora sp. TBRC 11914]|uniref:glutamate-1-semialdehyde 2,1-aminomutase n=1 Tax=Actinomycetospora sp. TBRC 11914 TaxID=2729387 RepID=UPI00145EDCEF|nr:glutamate-1-semialdehyde 2,1-aminomutase [Actinomycetospora sp. TBRC 11914]NMO92538.1 glutamate-1-semialdehyde 2,1-aminomutase [Actinomycetospora sp. TBRC 11914]
MDYPGPSFARSNELQSRLHDMVPGGAHTYARGDDQYPEDMAPIIERGLGARVWDADGNCFVEYGMGLRAVTLGHQYGPVVDAVRDALTRGVSFTRPSTLEVAAAEDFLSLVPGAEMVKFAKNGSDATTAALRLARAVTGRDLVAVADQPFFSTDDWFIGATGMPGGIPVPARHEAVRFTFNDLESLQTAVAAHPGRIAAVFMEAATGLVAPDPGYLRAVRDLCTAEGIVLVFDEMITGFRWAAGGAQEVYGVVPDLSTWGKAMGNGFSIAALAGRRELMERGGLDTDDERVFLLSTTSGPELVGLAAFRAVAEAYRTTDPVGTMRRTGGRLAAEVNAVVDDAGLSDHLDVAGDPSCLVFRTRDAHGLPSQEYRTLFLAELLRGGVLGQSFVVSAAHTAADVDLTVAAVAAALPTYAKAIELGTTDGLLEGRPVAPALRPHATPRRRAAVVG